MHTLHKFIHKIPKFHQYLASLGATFAGFILGTVLSWSSPALPDLEDRQDFGTLGTETKSWIVSLATVGAIFGAAVAGQAMDRIGRKRTMLLLSIPCLLGWLLIGFADNLPMIFSGRCLCGFAIGAFSLAIPIYISEVTESSIRGNLGVIINVMATLGILFTFVIGTCVSWKTLSIVSAVFPVVFAFVMVWMPETPKYFMIKKDKVNATKSLRWLRRQQLPDKDDPTIDICNEIEKSLERSKQENVSIRGVVRMYWRPVVIMLALFFFNQFSGFNAVGFYTEEIFLNTGTSLDPNMCTIIVAILQVIAAVISSLLVDRCGRRLLLLVSFLAMTLSLATLAAFFQLKNNSEVDLDRFNWLPLLAVIVFNFGYYIGIGPLVWVLIGEILPNQLIGLASSFAVSFNWTLAFIVTKFFGTMNDALGMEWCFWLFTASCFAGIFFVYFCVPETNGKSLEEIQNYFKSKTLTQGNTISEPNHVSAT